MWWIIGTLVAVIIMMVAVLIAKSLCDSTKLPIGTTIKIDRDIKSRECIVGTFCHINVDVCAVEDIKGGEAEICGREGELYLIRNVLK